MQRVGWVVVLAGAAVACTSFVAERDDDADASSSGGAGSSSGGSSSGGAASSGGASSSGGSASSSGGGSSSGSASSSSSSSSSGGSSGSCAGALLCEDFEGADPLAAWTMDITGGTGTLVVGEGHASSGALHATITSDSGFRNVTIDRGGLAFDDAHRYLDLSLWYRVPIISSCDRQQEIDGLAAIGNDAQGVNVSIGDDGAGNASLLAGAIDASLFIATTAGSWHYATLRLDRQAASTTASLTIDGVTKTKADALPVRFASPFYVSVGALTNQGGTGCEVDVDDIVITAHD